MRLATVCLALTGLLFGACGEDGDSVVLYCGVDQDQSRRIADLFTEETGVAVDYHGEVENMRSIGLPQRLMRERSRPGADVYWSNEIMHMVHLCRSGLMAPLPEGATDGMPEAWRDPKGQYVAFGARARVFLVNTELLPDEKDHPSRVEDLLDPKYAAMGLVTSMAEPLTGTTYTHAVALLSKDEEAAKGFFQRVAEARDKGTMKVVGSNGRVMRLVADKANKCAFGLTDTDDSWIALMDNPKLKVIYPDGKAGEAGTLLIPNTVALVKGGPNPEAGARLLRWLVSGDIEAELARSRSAQIPLRPGVALPEDRPQMQWRPGEDFQVAAVDWHAVAANVDRWRNWLTALFKPAN